MSEKQKLLIVDDSELNRDILKAVSYTHLLSMESISMLQEE